MASRPASRNLEGGLAALLLGYTAICCASLIYVAGWYPEFHIFFDPLSLHHAALALSVLTAISFFFSIGEFSFGYFVSFYLYNLVMGYIWLSYFSHFEYDLALARLSAVASLLAFLIPAVLITAPLPRTYELSRKAFHALPTVILVLAATIVGIGTTYGFRLVGLQDMYSAQRDIAYPTWLNYLIGATSTTLLPFAFACFAGRRALWKAVACLIVASLFYPITLNKSTLLTPGWLLFLLILLEFFKPRTVVILSLLIPVSAGLLLLLLLDRGAGVIFGTVNFRMLAIPASMFDIYNDYFSKHDLTYFCQISLLKFSDCAYRDQLGVVLANKYHLGNLNGSLFVTEGIASVGVTLAPASAFACGLLVALANRASAGLKPSFILTSAAVLPQVFMNVPLSTILLSHGGALLFLLWYVCPRDLDEIAAESTPLEEVARSPVAPTPFPEAL